jgi:hypothetical protein
MNHWNNRYAERVKLLVEILPTLAKERRFALKGGTAINLFEHDLPRLSIDLTWLPIGDFRRTHRTSRPRWKSSASIFAPDRYDCSCRPAEPTRRESTD